MKKLIYIILLSVLLLFSCRTKTVYVPVESIRTEKEYVDRLLRDSIHIHDSIFYAIKGDTILKEKYKTIYKDKLVRDSIFITDSVRIEVPYPVVEVKEVNRLRQWQIVLMCLGGVFIGFLGYRLFSWWRK